MFVWSCNEANGERRLSGSRATFPLSRPRRLSFIARCRTSMHPLGGAEAMWVRRLPLQSGWMYWL